MRIAGLWGRSGLHLRVMVYVLVIAGFFLLRGGVEWRGFLSRLHPPRHGEDSLTVGGVALAPRLAPLLVESFRRDYPETVIHTRGGGTMQALEDLINRRTDVAFVCRPPTAEEQELFLTGSGDTAICFPIAVGGLILRRGEGSELREVSTAALREHLLRGTRTFDRLYLPDPNLGLWDVFCARLGVANLEDELGDRVYFLADEAAVLNAVEADPRGLGLTGSPSLSEDPNPLQSKTVDVSGSPGSEPTPPSYGAVASGAYPLHYHLHACCLRNAGVSASRFVTYAASARGQRQLERAGFLPARHPARPVYLSDHPLGGKE